MKKTLQVEVSDAEIFALGETIAEYGFSLEPGGINQDDEQAEEHYTNAEALASRLRAAFEAA